MLCFDCLDPRSPVETNKRGLFLLATFAFFFAVVADVVVVVDNW